MKYSSKIMFSTIMIISVLIVMNSTSWISMWMGLEINLMSFIPLLNKEYLYNNTEASLMYFLIQSISSLILLTMIMMKPTMMLNSTPILMKTTMMMMILMKLGAAPFHFWMPEMMNKMNWLNCFILSTWQKIAPMFILVHLINNLTQILIVLTSVMTGAILGINQTSLRKLMAFSSISHMGWMIACINNNMWTWYLIMYSGITGMAMMLFKLKQSFSMNQLMKNTTPMEMMLITSIFMSLGGLPPFSGFMPKWMAIQSMLNTQMIMVPTIMVMMSLLTLYFYIQMMSPHLMLTTSKMKWTPKTKSSPMVIMMLMLNFGIPLSLLSSFTM